MTMIVALGMFAMLPGCSDPLGDAAREYQTSLETHIQLDITDDAELCRISRKALRIALESDNKPAYGEWLLRVNEYCK